MRVPRSERKPKYRLHESTGQAFVQLNGKRRYLGPFDDPATKQRYQRLIGLWEANGRTLPPNPGSNFTIDQLCDGFEAWARKRYRNPDGRPRGEVGLFKTAIAPLRELYGATPANKFGPLALIVVREEFTKKKWCRRGVNRGVERVRRVFKWAAARELLPITIYNALQAIEPLKHGEAELPETKPIKPVPIEHVNAIRTHVSRQIWAIVRLQLLTGARGGEIACMRALDIDTTRDVWEYCPANHKTKHRGKERRIPLGPAAQDIVRPFLAGRAIDAFLFSPAEAEDERLQELHKKRIAEGTPLHHGNGPGTNRKKTPKRRPGTMYRSAAYGRAIARACELANVPHWNPHRIRHLVATEIRRKFGIEGARAVLGHSSVKMTEIYAEEDRDRAVEIVSKIG